MHDRLTCPICEGPLPEPAKRGRPRVFCSSVCRSRARTRVRHAAAMFLEFWRRGLLAYDDRRGIEWEWLAMDGALGKAPLGGEQTGPNPTDRAKRGRNGASSPRVRASRSG